jgi:hypothetical protein
LIGLEHTFVTLSEKNHTQKFYVKKAWFSEMSFPSSKVVPYSPKTGRGHDLEGGE